MGMKKTMTLKAAFWRFLCFLLAGLAGAAAIPFGLILAGTTFGFVTYADSSERSVKKLAPVLAATPDLADIQIPMGCKYLILDKKYQMLETSLEGEEIGQAMEYAISGKTNANINKQYELITRENEYVIIQYYIGSQFANEWLNKHLPPLEVLLYALIGINCMTVCIILTAKFAKSLRLQLAPLFQATAQVSQQNLDFEVGHSRIKEFEDVLLSFSDMKDKLKASLEQQWRAEQLQREQIAALAHDLKTPLTVIQGNIDLMNETKLNEEQQLYAGYIIDSSEQIQLYIKALIDISRATAGYQLCIEKIDVAAYMKQIEAQIHSLCLTKEIRLYMEIGAGLGSFRIDKLLLERAIMNVVNNALDYSPSGGAIYVSVQNTDGFLQISVTDEGKGFSPKALLHAQEQFFMDDESRSLGVGSAGGMHFGMGLYIADSIMKQHNGQLILRNSEQTQGAQVILRVSNF